MCGAGRANIYSSCCLFALAGERMGQKLEVTLPDVDGTTVLLGILSFLLAAAVVALLRRPNVRDPNDFRAKRERDSDDSGEAGNHGTGNAAQFGLCDRGSVPQDDTLQCSRKTTPHE